MAPSTTTKTASILVVDDVAVYRIAIRQLLETTSDLEVVATAKDGVEALEHIRAHKPDLVTLDLHMPKLDGIGVLKELATWRRSQRPRVVVFAGADPNQGEMTMQALQLGAADVVIKPSAHEGADGLNQTLLPRLRALNTQVQPALETAAPKLAGGLDRKARRRCLVIASSTGGPQALREALGGLPADFPVPVVVVQHIPAAFASSLADNLNESIALTVSTAIDGETLQPGHVYFPPGDRHLIMTGSADQPQLKIDLSPPRFGLRPAADVLFSSAAEILGPELVAAIFTGMGSDGTAGARDICEQGGAVVTQTADSCVVYGMPRSVDDAGLAHSHFEPRKFATLMGRLHYA